MTNRMLAEANFLLKEAIHKKGIEEVHNELMAFTKRKDSKNIIRKKKDFPNLSAFAKSIDRIVSAPKKEDSKTWKLQITENSLLLIYMLMLLEISPEEFIKKISCYNTSTYYPLPDKTDRFEVILSEIEDLKKIVVKTNSVKHSLEERFSMVEYVALWRNTLYFFSNQAYDFFSNPSYNFYYYQSYNFINNTLRLVSLCKKTDYYLNRKNLSGKLRLCIDYITNQMNEIYNLQILTQKDFVRFRELFKSGFCNISFYFLYEATFVAIDIIDRYRNVIEEENKKTSIETANTEDSAINNYFFNIVLLLKEIQEKNKMLLLSFYRLDTNLLKDNNFVVLLNSVNQLAFIELDIIINNISFLFKRDEFTNKLLINKRTNVIQILQMFEMQLSIHLGKMERPYNFPFMQSQMLFIEAYNFLEMGLNKIKGKPKFMPTHLQKQALFFIKETWKNNITPIIATGMGTGKTRIACNVIFDFLNSHKNEDFYVLVLVPAIVIKEWDNEMTQECNMDAPVVISEGNKEKMFKDGLEELVVYMDSYEAVGNNIDYYISNPPRLLIYDELHRLNNTQETQDKFFRLAELNKKVMYKMALTGTPVQNSIYEFGMNYYFFNEQDEYLPIEPTESIQPQSNQEDEELCANEKLSLLIENTEELQKKMIDRQMYFFGNSIENKSVINCKMVPVAMYKEHFKSVTILREEDDGEAHKDAEIRQYILSPKSFSYPNPEIDTKTDSSKIEFVKAIVGELRNDEKIIVFSHFVEPLYYLSTIFNERCVLEVGESEDVDINQYIAEPRKKGNLCSVDIKEFYKDNNQGGKQILLTSIQKSGTGRNLDVAKNMILLEAWWNPMSVLQTLYRIIRKGDNEGINIYLPMYFVEVSNGQYIFFDLEMRLWENMIDKVDGHNNFIDGLIELQKERESMEENEETFGLEKQEDSNEIKNLKFGKKELPIENLIDGVLVFDRENSGHNISVRDFVRNEQNKKDSKKVIYREKKDWENGEVKIVQFSHINKYGVKKSDTIEIDSAENEKRYKSIEILNKIINKLVAEGVQVYPPKLTKLQKELIELLENANPYYDNNLNRQDTDEENPLREVFRFPATTKNTTYIGQDFNNSTDYNDSRKINSNKSPTPPPAPPSAPQG